MLETTALVVEFTITSMMRNVFQNLRFSINPRNSREILDFNINLIKMVQGYFIRVSRVHY